MKLFFCDNSFRSLMVFRGDVLRHLCAQGHRLGIVNPTVPTNYLAEIAKYPQGCTPYVVPMSPTGSNILQDFKLFLAYLSLFRKERPDYVFCYTIKPNIYACLAARMLGIPVCDMMAGTGYLFHGNGVAKKLGRALYRFGTRRANHVLCLNPTNYQMLLDMGFSRPERLKLMKGGEGCNLEYNRYEPEPFAAPVRFLMIARVLYDKGYREFVEAARIVHTQHPEVAFELVGALDEQSPMGVPHEQVEHDVAEGHIRYIGETDDVPGYVLRDGVVVVLPSYYGEGMNRSLMEACAMGRPVITTRQPGCQEVVDDMENGMLVPTRDAQALADAMLRFIGLSTEQKQAMSKKSHTKAVQLFDVRDAVRVYDEILAEAHQ